MTPPGWTLYRIVQSNPPTLADFTSFAVLGGRPRHPDPEVERLWDGLSMYDTVERARRKARQLPYLGGYVARLEIPAGAAVRVERTPATPGHHTIWGDRAALLACVAAVVAA